MTVITSSFFGSFDLATVTGPVRYEFEKTSPVVAGVYLQQIQVLYNIFNTPTGTALDSADVAAAQSAFLELQNLATGNAGVVQNPDGSLQVYYLTLDMLRPLDVLFRSFEAVGAGNPSAGLTLDQLNRWKDYSVVSPLIQNTLAQALNATATNRSIQSLVELDYVSAGNDLIAEKLSGLEGAITLTKDIMSVLTTIQNLRNGALTVHDRTDISAPVPFDTNFNVVPLGSAPTFASREANAFQRSYLLYNSYYYTANVIPIPKDSLFSVMEGKYGADWSTVQPTGNIVNSFDILSALYHFRPNPKILEMSVYPGNAGLLSQSGVDLFKALVQQVLLLSGYKGQLSARFPEQVGDANSLYTAISKIYTPLVETLDQENYLSIVRQGLTPGGFSPNDAKALFAWLVDNPDSKGAITGINGDAAGDIQDAINKSTVAGQALNDTQKENVRNFLFVFEEFYKSASAILQRLSQIIEKMAANIK
ncbi:MAG: hypothetical protein ACK5MA_00530 [Parachlamydiaceae bacterium]